MRITEQQITTCDGEKISGEMIFRFTDVSLADFMAYRQRVRGIVGFGGLSLTKTNLEETVITARAREAAATAPAYHKEPVVIPDKWRKAPRLSARGRQLLEGLQGADSGHIITTYRHEMKNQHKITDEEIMGFFRRVHGIA